MWADSPAFQTCSLGLWSNMSGSGPICRSFRAGRGPIFAVTALPLRAGGCVRTPWWSNISQGRGQASQEVWWEGTVEPITMQMNAAGGCEGWKVRRAGRVER